MNSLRRVFAANWQVPSILKMTKFESQSPAGKGDKEEKMRILTAVGTSYPRLGKNSCGRELRSARHNYDSQKITLAEVTEQEKRLMAEIIREQDKIGIDIVSDGCVRWYCPVSYIAGRMSGVSPGSLHHFLDTNFHVRKAVVEKLPQWQMPLVADDFLFARSQSRRTVSPVLTGPATLLRYTENLTDFSFGRIGDAYTEVLFKEIRLLVSLGACFIRIDDPLLLEEERQWSYFCDLYSRLKLAAGGSFLVVKTYGGKAAHMLHLFAVLPCDAVGIDCATDKEVLPLLVNSPSSFVHKDGVRPANLSLGIVDSRRIFMEEPEDLARLIVPLFDKITGKVILEPSYGLEFIPRRYAVKKLQVLVEVKRILEGWVGKEGS